MARFFDRRDEESFLALYRPHTPALYRMALRLMGGRAAEAEDAVQESWLRAVPRLGEWRGEGALSTWLAGFVINVCRERLRRREESGDGAAERASVARHDSAEKGPGGEEAIDLERAIAALPDGARLVFVLYDLMGYTHEEIGARLEIAEGTSKSQLARARRELRGRLATGEVIHDERR